mgnify:CR=1 FL=1
MLRVVSTVCRHEQRVSFWGVVLGRGLTLVPADGPRCPLCKVRRHRPAAELGRYAASISVAAFVFESWM